MQDMWDKKTIALIHPIIYTSKLILLLLKKIYSERQY